MADPVTMAIVATVASAAGTLVSAVGQMNAGIGANRQAKAEAQQMEIAAGQERAAGIKSANEQRRQTAIVLSNAQAAAAASGASASDAGTLNLMGNLAGEGEYRALSQMYTGEQNARNYETQAGFKRFEGKQAAKAGRIGAVGTLISGMGSLYDKYGGGGGQSYSPGTQSASGLGASPMRATTTFSNGSSVNWSRTPIRG